AQISIVKHAYIRDTKLQHRQAVNACPKSKPSILSRVNFHIYQNLWMYHASTYYLYPAIPKFFWSTLASKLHIYLHPGFHKWKVARSKPSFYFRAEKFFKIILYNVFKFC